MSRYAKQLACLCALVLASALPAPTATADAPGFDGGHLKYFFLLNSFPDDSLFSDYIDSPATDHNGDMRLKFSWQADNVSLVTDYQMVARYGDGVELARQLPPQLLFTDTVLNDDRRLLDLTRTLSDTDNRFVAHRLDRLYINITSRKTVVRIGRQVLSWGNGLLYTPVDIFNPFDPAAVDKEYKNGDDMLYGQYLQQNGNDLQAVWVVKRNNEGKVSDKVDSIALKYHGFIGNGEYDLMLAEHYDDRVYSVGGLGNIAGAIWRGDITLTDTPDRTVPSLVTSLSYSWTAGGHNVSGLAEYFYNGFGQADGDYSPAALAENPELVERFLRGELYTLARHYVALSAMIEASPLWRLTPNLFINASDRSFLAQLVSSYDIMQNLQLLAAINLPVGADGTEYGGIDSTIPGKQLSSDLSLFAQLAWYF